MSAPSANARRQRRSSVPENPPLRNQFSAAPFTTPLQPQRRPQTQQRPPVIRSRSLPSPGAVQDSPGVQIAKRRSRLAYIGQQVPMAQKVRHFTQSEQQRIKNEMLRLLKSPKKSKKQLNQPTASPATNPPPTVRNPARNLSGNPPLRNQFSAAPFTTPPQPPRRPQTQQRPPVIGSRMGLPGVEQETSDDQIALRRLGLAPSPQQVHMAQVHMAQKVKHYTQSEQQEINNRMDRLLKSPKKQLNFPTASQATNPPSTMRTPAGNLQVNPPLQNLRTSASLVTPPQQPRIIRTPQRPLVTKSKRSLSGPGEEQESPVSKRLTQRGQQVHMAHRNQHTQMTQRPQQAANNASRLLPRGPMQPNLPTASGPVPMTPVRSNLPTAPRYVFIPFKKPVKLAVVNQIPQNPHGPQSEIPVLRQESHQVAAIRSQRFANQIPRNTGSNQIPPNIGSDQERNTGSNQRTPRTGSNQERGTSSNQRTRRTGSGFPRVQTNMESSDDDSGSSREIPAETFSEFLARKNSQSPPSQGEDDEEDH